MGSRGLQQFWILVEPAEITGSFQYPDGFAVQILVPVYSIGFIQVKEQSPLRWKGRCYKLHRLLAVRIAPGARRLCPVAARKRRYSVSARSSNVHWSAPANRRERFFVGSHSPVFLILFTLYQIVSFKCIE